jgi:uncharacterized protein
MLNDYVIRVHASLASVDAVAWDGLLQQQATPTPFMRHACLAALHDSGSACAATGWAPQIVTVHRDATLLGACAAYLKSHSYGEFVFDWSWANAFERSGRRYYPKVVTAAPFSPVPGTRLMAANDEVRALLVQALAALAQQHEASSVHALFVDAVDQQAFEQAGWSIRHGVQFHWEQGAQVVPDFDTYLRTLHRDKRKKIQQERRRVAEAGVSFRVLDGSKPAGDEGAIAKAEWDLFYRCHTNTYAERGSQPYLSRAAFEQMARTMPEHWLMVVASRQGHDFATSLVAKDDGLRVAYGRYWGTLEPVPFVHFEACYYQPLAWCLAHGFVRFEGGAQGEHKLARGFMPSATASAHWIADADFAKAVAHFVKQESVGVAHYKDELEERNPFKSPDKDATQT